jgi:hypothetical protein
LTIAERIVQELATWPDVAITAHGSRFIEFRIGRRELGHLHGSQLADVAFPVRIRETLVAEGKAMLHHHHPESGWVSVPIRSEVDADNVIGLFRLNYERPWLTAPGAPSETESTSKSTTELNPALKTPLGTPLTESR